jgi:hypothetical protein
MSDITVKPALIPTYFGDAVDITLPPETLMLVSVLTMGGLKPVRFLLAHQLYKKEVEELEKLGEVVITAVPYASKQVNVSRIIAGKDE